MGRTKKRLGGGEEKRRSRETNHLLLINKKQTVGARAKIFLCGYYGAARAKRVRANSAGKKWACALSRFLATKNAFSCEACSQAVHSLSADLFFDPATRAATSDLPVPSGLRGIELELPERPPIIIFFPLPAVRLLRSSSTDSAGVGTTSHCGSDLQERLHSLQSGRSLGHVQL